MSRELKQGMADRIMIKTAPFFEKVGSLSKLNRIFICLLTLIMITALYVYFIYMPRQDRITQMEKEYSSLNRKLATYRHKAANLAKYEKMMAAAQVRFNLAMKALPDKKEIPSLLTAISNAGIDSGLEFILFQPKHEIAKGFYAEIPVAIKIEGRYHQLAHFFDLVSRLYRIVNIKDITIAHQNKSDTLAISCRAVTYRFIEKKANVKGKHKRKK